MASESAGAPFAAEVDALAARLAARACPPGPVVLYGSSTVRLWPAPAVDARCEALVAVGFGGACLADLRVHYDRLVPALRPRVLLIAAGANDMERDGAGPEAIVARTVALVERARSHDPGLPIGIFLMKPAPVHGTRLDAMRAVNRALEQRFGAAGAASTAAAGPALRLIDGFTPLLAPDGQAAAHYYDTDRRHFNAAGYACWGRAIAATLPQLARPPS